MSRPSFRARRLEEAVRAYADFLAGGFPVTFEGTAETLQCATVLDRSNWLTLIGICEEAIAAGAGDLDIPVAIRCTSNRSYTLTFADTLALLKNLRNWAAGAQANSFRLKDLVAAAETGEALNDIDLTQGWP